MLQLLMLLFVATAQPGGGSQPETNLRLRETASPTPVTDKDLRPQKAPDCETEAEIQRTLEQLSHGEPGECFIRDISRLNRG